MLLRRFKSDRRGAAAVEFAFIAPLILMFYYGMAEASQGLLANRRTGHVATVVGDLVAQSGQITQTELTDVFKVGASIFKPMPTAPLGMRVTSIQIDANGTPTVLWSSASGTGVTALPNGAINGIPPTLLTPNTALVRSDTSYTYTSAIQKMLPRPIALSHTLYLRPRAYVAVTLKAN